MKRFFLAALAALLCSTTVSAQTSVVQQAPLTATAQSPTTQQYGDNAKREQITRKGVEYLLQKGQAEDGSFSKQLNPAITSLCLSALLHLQKRQQPAELRDQRGDHVFRAGSRCI